MSEFYIEHGDTIYINYLNDDNSNIQLTLDVIFNMVQFKYDGYILLSNDIYSVLDAQTIPIFKKIAFHALNEIKETDMNKMCLKYVRDMVDLYV